MELAWKLLDGDVAGAWDSVLAAASSATFFQTRAWAELLSRTFPGWRSDPILIEFSDGNRMVLPMMRHRRTGYRECTLPHVYGGPVFLRPPTAAHLEAAAAAPRWFPDITVIDNPFAPYRRDQQGLARWRLETTATDLAPGFDALWKRFRETHRRHYKSALKQGVTIALAGSLDDVDAYFSIYADSLRRWGDGAIGFYPRRLFREMLGMPEFGQGVQLQLARLDGVVIGGIVMLYHGTQAIYWHGVSDAAHSRAHPAPLLLVSAIQAASADRYSWFDLMGPNQHLKGVQHFKDGFASQRLPYDVYYGLNSVRGILFSRYRRFKERTLRRCSL